MTKFKVELSKPEDDSELRNILGKISMGKSISITLRKEPSFFDALSVEGKFNQVIVGRDVSEGKVVGFGVRSIKNCYVNGEEIDIGYLGGLRLLPEFRGGTLTFRGYSYFRELHKDGKAPFYLTTIVDDNESAKKLLTAQREGMPNYHDFGLYTTFVLKVSRNKLKLNKNISQASLKNLEGTIDFIQGEGKKKQFFPSYVTADFMTKGGLLRGLGLEDVFLYSKNGEIEGVMACWNQHSFKQTYIERYGTVLKLSRQVINFANQIAGNSPILPKEGKQLNYSSGALIVVKDDNPQVFDNLVDAVYNRAQEYQSSIINIGLHSKDPLSEVVKARSSINFRARLYVVTWEDNKLFSSLDNRVPYLELGSL